MSVEADSHMNPVEFGRGQGLGLHAPSRSASIMVRRRQPAWAIKCQLGPAGLEPLAPPSSAAAYGHGIPSRRRSPRPDPQPVDQARVAQRALAPDPEGACLARLAARFTSPHATGPPLPRCRPRTSPAGPCRPCHGDLRDVGGQVHVAHLMPNSSEALAPGLGEQQAPWPCRACHACRLPRTPSSVGATRPW